MTANEQLIHKFYSAFQNRDFKTMQSCYADNATFNDPVFINLNAMQVRSMWEMFCVNGGEMQIDFRNIEANEISGKAEWEATYIFSATKRKVVNNIKANFKFNDGKIIKHTDDFSFYKWARQALGTTGLFLGWTSFLKNKVQHKAVKSLQNFINRKMK